jgi:coenzyme F420 biosynthesis associated uncharacterized protein
MASSSSPAWDRVSPAARLLDWGAASSVGRRLALGGPSLSPVERARLAEDFSEVVEEAEDLITVYTGLTVNGYRSRAWVQSRPEWIDANLRAFQRVLGPFAERLASKRPDGALAGVRRAVLGGQLGALTGYLSRKVLGQYDLFLPPDDDGMLYFVSQNVAAIERRHGFPPRDFRLWIALHEVGHRVQFGAVPWLRGELWTMIDEYLSSMELDPKRLLESLRRAVEEARRSREWRGLGILFLLMTPEQRETFRRMQATMSLLEGHANHLMNALSEGKVREAARMRRTLKERREHRTGVEKAFQRAIGFDTKAAQYASGERFVNRVVEQAGMEAFNRVWERREHLPTLAEITRPDDWLARVGGAPGGSEEG